jgi:hypothetical protein
LFCAIELLFELKPRAYTCLGHCYIYIVPLYIHLNLYDLFANSYLI